MSIASQFFPKDKSRELHILRTKEDWESYAEVFMPAFLQYQKDQEANKTSNLEDLGYKEHHSLLKKDINNKMRLKRDFKIALKLTAVAIILSLILLSVVQHLADNSFFFYIPLILSVGLSAGCVFLYARLVIKTFEV